MKKDEVKKWPIPGFLLIGLGIGMLMTTKNPMAIPAGTLIGLGLGFLVAFVMARKK